MGVNICLVQVTMCYSIEPLGVCFNFCLFWGMVEAREIETMLEYSFLIRGVIEVLVWANLIGRSDLEMPDCVART